MARHAKAVCQDCGRTWGPDRLEVVADAVEEHEEFHDVEITRVATDGGRENPTYYVLDEDRGAVVAGPFQTQERASSRAADEGPAHIVATERALDIVELTSETTIRWEQTDEDVDVVTDGGERRDSAGASDEGWEPDWEVWLHRFREVSRDA